MINTFFRILSGIRRKFANIIWKMRLKAVGKKTVFDSGVQIYNPQNITIGESCTINFGVILQSCGQGKIFIGNNVIISYNSLLLTGGLDLEKFPDYKSHIVKDIFLEDNIWIGAGSIILPGVKIGSNSIVAAGSVVTKEVPSNVTVAGVPAKVIKNRFQ